MEHIKISHQILDQIENDELIPILIESPLASPTIAGLVLHKKFARACLKDSLSRGEAPYASHLLFAQEGLINDDIPEERALGIHAGLVWGKLATKTVVYTNLGISPGMQKGIDRAIKEERPIEYRVLACVPQVFPEEIALEQKRQEIVIMLAQHEESAKLSQYKYKR